MQSSFIRSLVFACAMVGLPALSFAQSSPWFVGGLGGVTFGTVTSGAVAGQVGVELAPNVFFIGEVGHMRNVLPKALRDDLDDFMDDLEFEIGLPVSFEVAVPSTYGFGGVRFHQPRGRATLFVEAGMGVGHVSVRVVEAEVLGIDFKDEVEELLDDEDASESKLLFALGGGVNAPMTETLSFDAGFRYTRIATEDPSINSAMVYVAVKIGRAGR